MFSYISGVIKNCSRRTIIICLAMALLSAVAVTSILAVAPINPDISIPVMAALWAIPFLTLTYALCGFSRLFKSIYWFYLLLSWSFLGYVMFFIFDFYYGSVTTETFSSASSAARGIGLWAAMWSIPAVFAAIVALLPALMSFLRAHIHGRLRRICTHIVTFARTYGFYRIDSATPYTEKGGKRALWYFLSALACLVTALALGLIGLGAWTHINMGKTGFAAVLFTMKYSGGGISEELFSSGAAVVIPLLVVGVVCIAIFMRRANGSAVTAKPLTGGDSTAIRFVRRPAICSLCIALCALIASSIYSGAVLDVKGYLSMKLQKTTIYDDYYVKPTAQNVIFPEKKRNLICINIESIETTFTSKEHGGDNDIDYIPELSKLAEENLNFSNSDKLGGSSLFISELLYTMGSVVGHTGGVTLMTPMNAVRANGLSKYSTFLPGLVTMEDILHDNGYNQLFMRGEDTEFAGYANFAGKYDNSKIFDYQTAIERGYIDEDYYEHWGIEDMKLYEYAKGEVLELAKMGEPFCATIATMDTHGAEQGYICPKCDSKYENTYATAVSCASRQASEFIEWLSEQDFYDNTTIIVTGDHLSALRDSNSFINHEDDYTRTTYNCFINAVATPSSNKHRTFSTLDLFPTTLCALGAEIKGDRLGLGTNLFSTRKTLAEELGADYYLDEISKQSDYYIREFWLI